MNSRIHFKIQKSAIFIKKKLNLNMLQINSIVKLGTIVIMEEIIEVMHIVYVVWSIVYLKTKEIPIAFYNGPKYDYHFIIKELIEEPEKEFTCLVKNTEKSITFSVPTGKEVTKIDKMEKKLQKIYLTYYNLLTMQDLWQTYYQIL